MLFMDVVRARRSIRNYLDKPVEREKIMQCVEAARLAPSACNAQPWRFIIVDDPQLKEKFAASVFNGLFAMEFARKAPVLVAVVNNQQSFVSRVGGKIRGVDYSMLDLGIAGEHFVLQAAELGLGTCWIGWFNERVAKKALCIPRGKKIAYLLSVGYPSSPQEGAHRRKQDSEMSGFNGWGNGKMG